MTSSTIISSSTEERIPNKEIAFGKKTDTSRPMKRSRIREPFALIRSRFEERGLSHGGAKWHALAPCATCPRLPPLVYLILI